MANRRELMVAAIGVLGAGALALSSVLLVHGQAAPAVPATFTAAARSSCIVDLAWTAASGSGPKYAVEYTTQPTFFAGGTAITTTANMSVVHEGLSPATTYRYRIQSVDGVNSSAWKESTPPSITTPALPAAPAIPAGFGATGVNDAVPANDGKQVDLAWTSPTLSQYGGFVIERFTEGSTGGWNAVATLPYQLRAYRDGGGAAPLLDNTRIYRYHIRAFESAEGCGENNRVYSDYSAEVTVPAHPTNLTSQYVYNPDVSANKIDLAWTAGSGQTTYEIQRKTGNGTFTFLTTVTPNTTSFSDSNVVTNEVYAYRVRGCKETGGLKGCSAFTNETSRRVANAPQNLVAFVKSFTTSGGVVQLTWENTFAGSGNYIVERAEGSGNFSKLSGATILAPGGANPPSSVTYDDTSPLLGKSYRYRVQADFGGVEPNRYSAYSNETPPVNLNIQPINGWAWSGHGLGWVRLSNDSVKSSWGDATGAPNESGIPYMVYMEKDPPYYLGGFAWNPYGGWLSFNETSGCPSGGSCRAQVDLVSSAVSGWAKFVGKTAADGTALGLDRWVSLSQKSGELAAFQGTGPGKCNGPCYGLYYTMTTENNREVGQLRGFAWGGDVVGWVAFGTPAPSTVAAPRILSVTAETPTEVKVEWENPVDYPGGVEIRMSEPQDPNCADPTNSNCFYKKPPQPVLNWHKTSVGEEESTIIQGLTPNTLYGFKVRGYTQ